MPGLGEWGLEHLERREVRCVSGLLIPCAVVHPVRLPLSELGKLGYIRKLEAQGHIPAFILNEWLRLNCPDMRFDNDPKLREEYSKLGEILEGYPRTLFDMAPPYIKRSPAAEAECLRRSSPQYLSYLTDSLLEMLLGPGSEGKGRDGKFTHACSEAKRMDQAYYDRAVHMRDEPKRLSAGIKKADTPISLVRQDMTWKGWTRLIPRRDRRLGSITVFAKVTAGGPIYYAQLAKTGKRKYWKSLNKFFPHISPANKRKQQFTVAEVVWMIAGPEASKRMSWGGTQTTPLAEVNRILRLFPIGSWNATVAGHLVATLLLPQAKVILDTYEGIGLHKVSNNGQAKVGKFLTMMFRRTSRAPDGTELSAEEVMACSYYNLLSGRAIEPVDWEQEIKNRQDKDVHFVPVYGSNFSDVAGRDIERFFRTGKSELLDMWEHLYTPRHGKEPFREAMWRRLEWATSGSDHKKGLELDGRPVHKVTKRLTIEEYSASDVLKWLSEPPQEHATGSEKGELGGLRAILAPDMKHYLISTYSVDGLENRLHCLEGCEKGLKGVTLLGHEETRAIQMRSTRASCSNMLDYVDFNAQHDSRTERMLFTEQLAIAKASGCDETYQAAIRWHADSKLAKRIRTPDGKVHAVTKGLFSGTRTTDLGNTLCNQLYLRVASRTLFETFPWLEAVVTADRGYSHDTTGLDYRVHQGDDVFLAGDRLLVFMLQQHMINSGYKLNQHKQLVGHIGEYLRKAYTTDSAMGFPTRAIANLMVRKFESVELHEPRAEAFQHQETCGMLVRRGCTEQGVGLLHRALLKQACNVRSSTKDAKALRLPTVLAAGASSNGGWGAGVPGGRGAPLAAVSGKTAGMTIDVSRLSLNTRAEASRDYIKHLSLKLGGDVIRAAQVFELELRELKMAALGPRELEVALESCKQELARVQVVKLRGRAARDATGEPPPSYGRLLDYAATVLVVNNRTGGADSNHIIGPKDNVLQWLCSRNTGVEGWRVRLRDCTASGVSAIDPKPRAPGALLKAMRLTAGAAISRQGLEQRCHLPATEWSEGLNAATKQHLMIHLVMADRNAFHPMHGGYGAPEWYKGDLVADVSYHLLLPAIHGRNERASVLFTACSLPRMPKRLLTHVLYRRPPPGEGICLPEWYALATLFDIKPIVRLSDLSGKEGQTLAGLALTVIHDITTAIAEAAGHFDARPRYYPWLLQAVSETVRQAVASREYVNAHMARAVHKMVNALAFDMPLVNHLAECVYGNYYDACAMRSMLWPEAVYPGSPYAKKEAEILPAPALLGKAIAASPLKSIAKTMVAYGLGRHDAMLKCLAQTKMDSGRVEPLASAIRTLLSRGDSEMVDVLLEGADVPRLLSISYLTGSYHSYVESVAVHHVFWSRVNGYSRCRCSVRQLVVSRYVQLLVPVLVTGKEASLQRY